MGSNVDDDDDDKDADTAEDDDASDDDADDAEDKDENDKDDKDDKTTEAADTLNAASDDRMHTRFVAVTRRSHAPHAYPSIASSAKYAPNASTTFARPLMSTLTKKKSSFRSVVCPHAEHTSELSRVPPKCSRSRCGRCVRCSAGARRSTKRAKNWTKEAGRWEHMEAQKKRRWNS